MRTTLDSTGRITLPALVQSQLGLKPGDAVSLEPEGGRWVIVPVIAEAEIIPTNDRLDWEDLEYESVPLEHAGRIKAVFRSVGDLEPLPIDED